MRELPMLFTGEMVRAILAGRKTQTRRLKFSGQPGDVIWVRETWRILYRDNSICTSSLKGVHWTQFERRYWPEFKADTIYTEGPWRPARFMYKYFARLWLDVLAVREERLHDISEEDAKAEGVGGLYYPDVAEMRYTDYTTRPYYRFSNAVDSFRTLWDSINAKKAPWDSNPRVQVVTFKRREAA